MKPRQSLWLSAREARRRGRGNPPVAPAQAPWRTRPGEDEHDACRRWVKSVAAAFLEGVAVGVEAESAKRGAP